ncbi:MAG TPA: non-homologous end-joining DNA ligase [Methanomicrobiales archaeon]|nr:non-homologous end-joining DNA ligase [Methanomicrobiales archaeon]
MAEPLTRVEFTHLPKVLYPEAGITKLQVVKYFITIAPRMLPFLEGRPIVLTRYPNGVSGKGFYEKDAPMGTPDWVETWERYSETADRVVHYIVCNNLDTLLWIANLDAIEIHIMLSPVSSPENPDLLFIDLDPEPPATTADAARIALLVRDRLASQGIRVSVKTSGKRSFHLAAPLVPGLTYREVRDFVHGMGRELARENALVASEEPGPANPGKVLLDYAQNSPGRTMVAPYSLRATPRATVSAPVTWEEMEKGINPRDLNIQSVPKRKDPWEGILRHRQELPGGKKR